MRDEAQDGRAGQWQAGEAVWADRGCWDEGEELKLFRYGRLKEVLCDGVIEKGNLVD